jgi:hypothetical protein
MRERQLCADCVEEPPRPTRADSGCDGDQGGRFGPFARFRWGPGHTGNADVEAADSGAMAFSCSINTVGVATSPSRQSSPRPPYRGTDTFFPSRSMTSISRAEPSPPHLKTTVCADAWLLWLTSRLNIHRARSLRWAKRFRDWRPPSLDYGKGRRADRRRVECLLNFIMSASDQAAITYYSTVSRTTTKDREAQSLLRKLGH